MSDGITEGYRASEARKTFEDMWEEAHIENLLLDFKRDIAHFSIEELLLKLMGVTVKLEMQFYDRFLVDYKGKKYFTESVEVSRKHDVVKRYCVSGEFNDVFRRFETDSLIESMREAYLFAQWITSEEGKVAKEALNDW